VLLKELESCRGVVIFATNLAANFDPAFERRIRTQVLFGMPNAAERERIWRVQIHPRLTPLHGDVDFRQLAERYEATGGDIRNAVLKSGHRRRAWSRRRRDADDPSGAFRGGHWRRGWRGSA
jgi:ATP-dependent 26S proteasome regulatory subunit